MIMIEILLNDIITEYKLIKSLTILIYETVNKFQISVVAIGKIGLLEIATT